MTRDGLYEFMSRHKLGVLGTLGPDGEPQSALVGVAITQELEIVFDTIKSTRKYPNLITRAECSVVIGWDGADTVQYEGRAEELTEADLPRYQEIYFRAWPDGPARLTWPGIVYFLVRPKWIRYSDFGQEPPLIEEFTF